MIVIPGIDFNYENISETLSFHYVSMGKMQIQCVPKLINYFEKSEKLSFSILLPRVTNPGMNLNLGKL